MVAVALPCGWLATEMKAARRQRDVARAINDGGGGVFYDCDFPFAVPAGQQRLRGILGDDLFLDVTGVEFIVSFHDSIGGCFATSDAINGVVNRVTELPHLEGLYLRATGVTDARLEPLARLVRLRSLDLGFTHVTDVGLKHLARLMQLRSLDLCGTRVTDAGIAHLEGLTQLEELSLDYTGVTDAGLERFRGLTQLQHLNLSGTKVTDAGLRP